MIRPQYHKETDAKRVIAFIELLKDASRIDTPLLQRLFSRQVKKDKDGKMSGIAEPEYYTSDAIDIPKGALPSVVKNVETTYGLYLFNALCLAPIFGERVEYWNRPLDKDGLEDLQQSLVDKLSSNIITGEEFGKFHNVFYFLCYKSTMFNPGNDWAFLVPNKKILAYKMKLLAENKDFIDPEKNPSSYAAEYKNRIETPLLAFAKKELMNDPAWPIYARGAKPSWGNNFKNTVLAIGPVMDPVSGKYVFINEALSEGMANKHLGSYSNILINAAYSRAVSTQDGGAKTKQIFAAMQSVTSDERGTDCHSKKYITKTLTKKNIKENLMRFIVDEKNKKLVRLTYDNAAYWMSQGPIQMRSAMFCKGEKYCNVCLGDYLYDLGVRNIGNTATKASSTMMNKSLKAMHDISVKTSKIDPFKYLEKV